MVSVDGGLGSGSVSLSSGATLAFNNTSAVVLANAIGGLGQVVASGTGGLTLSGANAFSGGARLTAGTLKLASPTAIGSGTFFLTGGALT